MQSGVVMPHNLLWDFTTLFWNKIKNCFLMADSVWKCPLICSTVRYRYFPNGTTVPQLTKWIALTLALKNGTTQKRVSSTAKVYATSTKHSRYSVKLTIDSQASTCLAFQSYKILLLNCNKWPKFKLFAWSVTIISDY